MRVSIFYCSNIYFLHPPAIHQSRLQKNQNLERGLYVKVDPYLWIFEKKYSKHLVAHKQSFLQATSVFFPDALIPAL